jgi:cation diffusion facilitator family transporter
MTELLLRLFIKEKDPATPGAREAYGRLAGLVGISSNILLFAAKLVIGLLSASISILADAVNNLSDCASSAITLAGFHLSARPADSRHPYGHARYEYISSLAVSCLILVIGFQFLISSFQKVRNPEPVVFSPVVVAVLVLSILIKQWQGLFNRHVGRRIQSPTLIATAADSRNDVLTTAAVLLSTVIAHLTGWQLDGYMGMAVALFILYAGIGLIREALNPLLGEAPDAALVAQIEEKIRGYDTVIGLHDLVVHDYGPDRRFASVHVEFPAAQDILVSHDIIDNIERDFAREMNILLVVHLDPVITDDPKLDALHEKLEAITREIDPALSIHDFRMVEGASHTNLLFDVVVPARYRLTDEALRERYAGAVETLEGGTYYSVVTIDRSYLASVESR